MSFRTKLFFYFLSLSTLIMAVGIIFYTQLRNLITPLTPASIPESIEKLGDNFRKNEMINSLINLQISAQRNLEYYIFTHNQLSLSNYHLNQASMLQLLDKSKNSDTLLSTRLTQHLTTWLKLQNTILQTDRVDPALAKKILLSAEYTNASDDVKNTLEKFHAKFSGGMYEDAAVTVKLAVKNSRDKLHESLNTTTLIFIDALLISFLFALFSARTISRPINQLRNNMEEMRTGKLDVPIEEELLLNTDDIGDLARSFSELMTNLRSTMVWGDDLLNEIERRKKTEMDLRETAYRLQETNRELDQFAYIASHDLRSPLRGIESLVTFIKEDAYHLLPETSRHNFDLIKKRAERLEALINGILEYSRAGRMQKTSEKIDVSQLIFEIVETISNPKNIKFIFETPMPIINANKISLTQVFQNLFTNAVKYHDKIEGQVSIGCTFFPDYYQFYVADDGPGILPEFHTKIFEIFQTLQSRDSIESAGIGLSIVKKIVENQGGKVWLTSEIGKGTTFYFTWPKIPLK